MKQFLLGLWLLAVPVIVVFGIYSLSKPKPSTIKTEPSHHDPSLPSEPEWGQMPFRFYQSSLSKMNQKDDTQSSLREINCRHINPWPGDFSITIDGKKYGWITQEIFFDLIDHKVTWEQVKKECEIKEKKDCGDELSVKYTDTFALDQTIHRSLVNSLLNKEKSVGKLTICTCREKE